MIKTLITFWMIYAGLGIANASEPWSMQDLQKISMGSFKAETVVSPLGYTSVVFKGMLPSRCASESYYEIVSAGVFAIYLNPECKQGLIENYLDDNLVDINWPSIRKEKAGDYLVLRGEQEGKIVEDQLIDVFATGFEGEGEFSLYSDNNIFLGKPYELLLSGVDETIVLNAEEFERGDHLDHPKWLQYQAKKMQDVKSRSIRLFKVRRMARIEFLLEQLKDQF